MNEIEEMNYFGKENKAISAQTLRAHIDALRSK